MKRIFSLGGGLLLAGSLALLSLPACSPATEQQQQSPVEAAESAVMARHDSLMGRMDQLMALKGQLEKTGLPTTAPYLRGLQAADNAMMSWMHAYQEPDSSATDATRLEYYQQQQQILDRVAQQQQQAIDSASTFLNQQPTPAAH